jgi:hypothetical protein
MNTRTFTTNDNLVQFWRAAQEMEST